MKEKNKVFWKGVEELHNEPEFIKNNLNEFPASVLAKGADASDESAPDRRDFLKLVGFSVAAATLAACEAPVKKAIPYLNKPEEIEPGIANWYATTFAEGGDYASILVKTREGRPIKIEGNKLSSVTGGATSARVQASVLSLYDTERLKGVQSAGKASSWEVADAAIVDRLSKISQEGGAIRIVSSTILSPTTKKVIAEFKSKYPTTEHVVYDAISSSAISKANAASFGKAVIPSYRFDKADTIVSFGADFLCTWGAGDYSSDFAKNRKLNKNKKTMNRLYAFESSLSLTGSNADFRAPIKLSQEGLFVAELYNRLTSSRINTEAVKNDILDKAVKDLLASKGKSLVVSGSNDVNVQILINEINLALGNYGSTINLNTPVNYRLGDDEKMNQFVDDLKGGKIAAVIFYAANPAYDHPRAEDIKAGLKQTKLSISFADRADETASLVEYIAPDHHYLESWNDAEPKAGFYSLGQPTIAPLFKTRQAQESLLKWSGNNADYYTYLKNNWSSSILNGGSWDKALHDGVYEGAATSTEAAPASSSFNASDVAAGISKVYTLAAKGIDLKLYEKVGVGAGVQANNPWLQELPDPISKATWDNYLAVSKKYADDNKLKEGDLVDVKVGDKKLAKPVPVLIQPGQAQGTASLALGYGREKAGKVGTGVGANAFALATVKDGLVQYAAFNVTITPTGGFSQIAQTQTHHTIMNRPIIQDATLTEYQANPAAGRFFPTVTTPDGKVAPAKVDIWKDQHVQPNHKWGMSIDLNTCLGCGACVIACQAENNVPVVGKREVINRREMHWIRIDRYYSSAAEPKETGVYFKGEGDLEMPEENPQVTFQPMMCQHCNHAPCESVCPVAATTHSTEGLNQMTYNRCVGTRYCANNCPYKVRRFNWFKYFDNEEVFDKNTSMNTALGRMVLNPDVTVRSRGVMEKCSMCVQRIQEGKLTAKKEKRKIKDGEINIACAAACATGAITFGDQNDPESQVSLENDDLNKDRAYAVLEELNVQPNVFYLTKIRNI